MNSPLSWSGNACWWGLEGSWCVDRVPERQPIGPRKRKGEDFSLEKKTEDTWALIEAYSCRMHVQSFCGAERFDSGVVILPVTREKWPASNFYFIFTFFTKSHKLHPSVWTLYWNLCTTHLFSKYLELTGFQCNAQLDNFDLGPQRLNDLIVIKTDTCHIDFWFSGNDTVCLWHALYLFLDTSSENKSK